ncbi:MAG: MFS transporter [Opitutales bacterium]|nr:MFS transporter [Opitutales bacterium]
MLRHLRHRTKAGYGVAEFGLSAAELLLQFYLFEFYTRVVGLEARWAGTALALAVFWDAVSDPLMGVVTDRAKTRFGRYVPFLILGALMLPPAVFAIFHPPEFEAQFAAFAYLLFTYICVNTAMTVIGVPHLALGGALTPDTNERTEVYGWKLVFGTLGLFFGILAPLLAVGLLGLDVTDTEGLRDSRGWAATGIGGVILLTAAVTVWSVWRPSRLAEDTVLFTWKAVREGSRAVFRSKIFLPIFLAFVLVSIARAMNASLALPFYRFTLELSEADVQKWILGVFSLCIVFSVAVWIPLGQRFGKKWPAFSGMLTLGLMTMVLYPLFPAGQLFGPVLAAVIGGVAVGAIILFESMVTDAADADRLESREERSGLYFGYWRMGQKLARSVGLGLTGWITWLIGFEARATEQSAEVARSLAYVFGPGVGVFFIAAALIFARSPLSKERQEAIQNQLSERAATRQG